MDGDAGFSTDHGYKAPVWLESEAWDPEDLPIRPWIAPGYFLRGHVTTIVGPGGVSKSSLVLAYVVALALKVELHGMHPRDECRSFVFNAEDDADEQRRRLTAILASFGRKPVDIAGKVFRTGPNEVGTLFERDPETGQVYPTAAMKMLKDQIRIAAADVLFVDPLAELHNVEENDNGAMRAIVAAFRVMAGELKIAVVIIHHTRKGVMVPGDPDAGRGASAIVGASRVVLTLAGMSEEEAKAFGLPPDTRTNYFRVDGGKANYSTLTGCEWFERISRLLPNDDTVSVPQPWLPPVDAVTPEKQVQVEAALRAGSPQGPYSPQLGNTARSVKHALVDAGIITTPGQRNMLAAIFKDGFVTLRFRDPFRKFVNGIRSPDGLPSGVIWEDQEDAPDDE